MKINKYILISFFLFVGCGENGNSETVAEKDALFARFKENGVIVDKSLERAGYYSLMLDAKKKKFPKDPTSELSLACQKLNIDRVTVYADGRTISKLVPVMVAKCKKVSHVGIGVYKNGGAMDVRQLNKLPLRSLFFSDWSAEHSSEIVSKVTEALNGMRLEEVSIQDIVISSQVLDSLIASQSTLSIFVCSKVKDPGAILERLLGFSALKQVEFNTTELAEADYLRIRDFKKEYEKRYSRKLVVMVMGAEP